MKISIALAANDHGFIKGDRVIVKVAKNEWYLGSVTRAGAKIKVDFDDGATATIEAEDFKDVRWMKKATKTLKRKATNEEAKSWSDAKRPVETPVSKTEKATKPAEKPNDPIESPGRVTEGGLIRLRHNRDFTDTMRMAEFENYFKTGPNNRLFTVIEGGGNGRLMLRAVGDTRFGIMCRLKFVVGTKGTLKITYDNRIVPRLRSTKWDCGATAEDFDPGSRMLPLVSDFAKAAAVVIPAGADGMPLIQPIITRFVADMNRLRDLNYDPISAFAAAGLIGDLIRVERPGTMSRISTASHNAMWAERRELKVSLPKDFPSADAKQILKRSGLTKKRTKGTTVTLTRFDDAISMEWQTPVKAGDVATVIQHK